MESVAVQEKSKGSKVPAWLILTLIAVVAGGLLGFTNFLTADAIDNQVAAAAEAARTAVLPQASEFNALTAGSEVDYCYAGMAGGDVVGHVCQVTVKGYGGDIEVTVGVLPDGSVSGISVGGASFSETAGLGAKVKEDAFTSRFNGVSAPLAVTKDGGEIDAVTGATISSRAVVSAVNTACEYVAGIN